MELMAANGPDMAAYLKSDTALDRRFGNYISAMSHVYGDWSASHMEVVRDYIAGMTDGYALRCMREISLPDELVFER
jgi:dGTPase